MIGGLFFVGLLISIIGIVLLFSGIGGRVRASTQFENYSGTIGGVALIIGIVLMALSILPSFILFQ